MRTLLTVVALAFAATACSPESAKPPTQTSEAPTPPAADGDPRNPTVDPASINSKSPVADVMHAYVIPGSETLFAAESEDAPTGAAGWARLLKATEDVVLGCELLKEPGRSKGADWDAACDVVIAATKQTAEALKQESTEDMVFTDGDMMGGCTSCHAQFRDEPRPEGHLTEPPPT